MAKDEIMNVQISKPKLYIEDHGCLTFDFIIKGSVIGCCVGGYCIGHARDKSAIGAGLSAMMHIMDVVGVDCWEDLDLDNYSPTYVRMKLSGQIVVMPVRFNNLSIYTDGTPYYTVKNVVTEGAIDFTVIGDTIVEDTKITGSN